MAILRTSSIAGWRRQKSNIFVFELARLVFDDDNAIDAERKEIDEMVFLAESAFFFSLRRRRRRWRRRDKYRAEPPMINCRLRTQISSPRQLKSGLVEPSPESDERARADDVFSRNSSRRERMRVTVLSNEQHMSTIMNRHRSSLSSHFSLGIMIEESTARRKHFLYRDGTSTYNHPII